MQNLNNVFLSWIWTLVFSFKTEFVLHVHIDAFDVGYVAVLLKKRGNDFIILQQILKINSKCQRNYSSFKRNVCLYCKHYGIFTWICLRDLLLLLFTNLSPLRTKWEIRIRDRWNWVQKKKSSNQLWPHNGSSIRKRTMKSLTRFIP